MNNDGLTLNQLAERNSALVTELEKLCTERDRLAAENAVLKQYALDCVNAVEHWNSWADKEDQIYNDIETTATSTYLAEIKADAANQMCVAFVKHKELAGISDDDVVTVREATDAVLHCADVISEGAK